MKTPKLLFSVLLLIFNMQGFSQNLEVTGIVKANGLLQSVNGGVKFPDQTVQTTAAFNATQTFPNQNAFPRGRPYILITTTSPAIPDTLEVVELSQGGMSKSGVGAIIATDFICKINMENVSPLVLQKLTIPQAISKLTFYFPDANTTVPYKTIELRSVFFTNLTYSSNFIGNSNYVHLMQITITFGQIEVKTMANNQCFCWNFSNASNCTCD